jgi:multiple sugar transport system ATP-binding protein
MGQSGLQLTGIAKSFGTVGVIRDVDLDIAPGELLVFVGPSGCGKSTLLRLIAGLEQPTAGTIRIGDRDVTAVPPAERGIAMVFQSYALYPHMTVAQNMGFGLRIQGLAKPEIRARVARAAQTLQLTELLERKPRELSGGQRQRVAIGRAIVRDPQVFLFDEPLSNLDAALRGQMRVEIARLHAQLGATMIYVTHDQVEAMTLATRIVVLNAGRVEQIGTPLELYRRPANMFVAGFLGAPRMNFLPARLLERAAALCTLSVLGATLRLALRDGQSSAESATLGVRPEDAVLAGANEAATFRGRVSVVERLGGETLVHLQLDGAPEQFTLKVAGDIGIERGAPVGVRIDTSHCHVFDATGRSLGAETAATPRSGIVALGR